MATTSKSPRHQALDVDQNLLLLVTSSSSSSSLYPSSFQSSHHHPMLIMSSSTTPISLMSHLRIHIILHHLILILVYIQYENSCTKAMPVFHIKDLLNEIPTCCKEPFGSKFANPKLKMALKMRQFFRARMVHEAPSPLILLHLLLHYTSNGNLLV